MLSNSILNSFIAEKVILFKKMISAAPAFETPVLSGERLSAIG